MGEIPSRIDRTALPERCEIALLRDVLRTATVTAATDVSVLGIERDAFLVAVTGYSESRELAHSIADEHLTAQV